MARALAGEPAGTLFRAQRGRVSSFKLWLKYAKPTQGRLTIDEGAERALRERGTSLLPVGVVEVDGEFEAGDAVEVRSRGGGAGARNVGKGIVNYSAGELRRIKGLKTEAVRELLPRATEEAVHRDYFVLDWAAMPALAIPGTLARWPPPPSRSPRSAQRHACRAAPGDARHRGEELRPRGDGGCARAARRRDPRGERAAIWRRGRRRPSSGLLDRLKLTESGWPASPATCAQSLRCLTRSARPSTGTGSRTVSTWRVRVPIGVVAVVFEARPNVSVDCSALCLKSGNAIVLRGSSIAAHSNAVLAQVAAGAAESAGVRTERSRSWAAGTATSCVSSRRRTAWST